MLVKDCTEEGGAGALGTRAQISYWQRMALGYAEANEWAPNRKGIDSEGCLRVKPDRCGPSGLSRQNLEDLGLGG